jgi:aminopeptidase N
VGVEQERRPRTTDESIALAERVSGQQLDELFETWLFTAGKPASATLAGQSRIARSSTQRARERAGTWVDEVQRRLEHGRY